MTKEIRNPKPEWEAACVPRSADFQSAVSRISNPQAPRTSNVAGSSNALPTGSRRYSRLETCATMAVSCADSDTLNRTCYPLFMLKGIIDFSLKNRFIVLLGTLALVLGGVYAVKNIPLDAIPDLSDVQVIISANSHHYDFLRLPVINDLATGGGPMMGIWSSLMSSSTEYNLVLSCDMPLITAGLLQHLIDSANGCTAAIAWHRGFAEPLCGIYSRSLMKELENHIREGKFKLITFLEKIEACQIEIDKKLPFYHENLFLNVNTPQEVKLGENLAGIR